MQIITPINIDLINVSPLPIINLKQGDTGRGILVTVTANGNVCEFTTETVNIYIKKPDGTMIYNACTIQDGKIKAMFTNQALAVPGKIPVELEVISESDRLSTPIAIANILPSNIDSDAIESSNEFTALTQALQQVTESTTAANQAAQAANTAASNANSAAQAANEAAESVTEAKEAAESAASAANTAAGAANTAARQANTAAGNANSAAQAANTAATNANNAVASIGDVNNLETTDKSNLVAAINELNDDLDNKASKSELNTALSGVRLVAGTKILAGSGGTSAALLSRENVNNLFGTSYPANGADYIGSHIGIFASNGDTKASTAHVDCVSYNPDTGMFMATFNQTVSGNIRINYLAVCF